MFPSIINYSWEQKSGEEGIRTLDLLTASQAGLTEQNITN